MFYDGVLKLKNVMLKIIKVFIKDIVKLYSFQSNMIIGLNIKKYKQFKGYDKYIQYQI